MQRGKLASIGSVIFLGLAILVFPNQFLFSKTVPNSFWTEYFPLPFGAGWFIAFIVLIPVVWLNKLVFGTIRNSVLGVLLSIFIAVPIALFIIGGTLSSVNVLAQCLWAIVICFPPLMVQIFLRWLFSVYAKKWLKKTSF